MALERKRGGGEAVTEVSADGACVLTVNGGSSSLKFAAYAQGGSPSCILKGQIERIATPNGRLVVSDRASRQQTEQQVDVPDLHAAARVMLEHIAAAQGVDVVAGVGHRVVHGGEHFIEPSVVTAEMLEKLQLISAFDPDHLPGEIALIETIGRELPGTRQVACFDTAFHRSMPSVAQIVPIPRRYQRLGVRRYGFHGLSYTYLIEELARDCGPDEAHGRVILAHLGSGASLCAVRGARAVDTTMGFTPVSGVPMGTRSGDLDPGLVGFLARVDAMTPERFHRMIHHESGLLGVSETSSDVRDLLARRETDGRAAEAIDLFCYQVRKAIGALSAVIGGVDTLVFSGGIGENSSVIRARICEDLRFLGIALDPARNATSALLVSAGSGSPKVRVIPTDEEAVIARETFRLLAR